MEVIRDRALSQHNTQCRISLIGKDDYDGLSVCCPIPPPRIHILKPRPSIWRPDLSIGSSCRRKFRLREVLRMQSWFSRILCAFLLCLSVASRSLILTLSFPWCPRFLERQWGSWQESSCLQSKGRALTRHQPCWLPDLGLPVSRTGRK